jgi:hypothetical protein
VGVHAGQPEAEHAPECARDTRPDEAADGAEARRARTYTACSCVKYHVALMMNTVQNPHMPALQTTNVHLDILMGRDETIDTCDFMMPCAYYLTWLLYDLSGSDWLKWQHLR